MKGGRFVPPSNLFSTICLFVHFKSLMWLAWFQSDYLFLKSLFFSLVITTSQACLFPQFNVGPVPVDMGPLVRTEYVRCISTDDQVRCRTGSCHQGERQVPPEQTFDEVDECVDVEPHYVLCYNPHGYECRSEVELCNPSTQLRASLNFRTFFFLF